MAYINVNFSLFVAGKHSVHILSILNLYVSQGNLRLILRPGKQTYNLNVQCMGILL